ncbi:PEP-CTERM sorting domain-containing protein [Janthinobacterium fluminis]|uniref:PEP-CTERM sorting domain-containing protein n=1 Tax=Janthinobacterium fluminis TaxID=2987524 RepID=A0ABT5K463_9BURK|nr:PEP-CTERM sorting domain-containing protein [Janthinobacterium fluminis]MDC8759724.1 PEP-CTERM sorting domain-containing protein [Janthinobacterium fluminis]
MKRVFGLLASFAVAASAQAAVVSYDFTVRVDLAYRCLSDAGCMNPSSVDMGNGEVMLGDIGHGRISFDTETPQAGVQYQPPAPHRGTRTRYQGAVARNDSFLRLGDAGAVFQQDAPHISVPVIEVGNDVAYVGSSLNGDHFNYYAAQNLNSYFSQSLDIELSDASGTALTGGGIPLRLDGLGYGRFTFSLNSPGTGDYSYVNGTITSLTLAAPVPEPETYAMLLAGIGMLAWRRKRAGARPR